MNFLYDDIVHALQNTKDSCINSATDRRGYVLERRFTKVTEITQTKRPLRRSRSSKVTDFGTSRKLIYDFLLVINTNLAPPILHRFRDIAFDRSEIAIFTTPLVFNPPPRQRGSPGTISVKILPLDGQRTKWRRNIDETFNRLSRVHERYRQTDRRAMTYSEREQPILWLLQRSALRAMRTGCKNFVVVVVVVLILVLFHLPLLFSSSFRLVAVSAIISPSVVLK